ncbi:MAG: hypothetical protein LBD13_04190 [Spirochaetaceae bacterium]|jgi:hypothetical protein|nr:hypothetical protein [Spirochaetaceae bacterium]
MNHPGHLVILLAILAAGAGTADAQADTSQSAPNEKEAQALPRTYRGLSLGMSLDELKDALSQDELFRFRGDRDVSFLPAREQNLVETAGFSFIKRAFFQLRSGAVFVMAFTMNTALVDYYSVFTAFVKKYGDPAFLDPKQAVWESAETRIAVERPLTVKYIDMQVFNELREQSGAEKSKEAEIREDFLHGF